MYIFNQLKDRFVFVDLNPQQKGQPIVISFKFLLIADRFAAIGIADVTSMQSKKDFYKTHHMSYLFSANGVVFVSHSQEENGRVKDFKFDVNQVIELVIILILYSRHTIFRIR